MHFKIIYNSGEYVTPIIDSLIPKVKEISLWYGCSYQVHVLFVIVKYSRT